MTVVQIYGMTEITDLCTLTFDVKHLGDVGPNVTIKLVDPDTAKICDTNEVFIIDSDLRYFSYIVILFTYLFERWEKLW